MSNPSITPARRRGRLTRDAVVEAAVLLFNQQGYDRTSMNEIAAVLGITKPALYYHFTSKEEILLVGIQRASEIIQVALDTSAKADASAVERIETFVRAYGKAFLDPIFRCLVLADERVLGSEGRAQIRSCKRHSQQQLESLLREAELAPEEVRSVALVIFGALNWTATSSGDRIGVEVERVTSATLRLLNSRLES